MNNIISIILIITILFLIYYNLKKEDFQTCNYNPKGTTELVCRSDCKESVATNDDCGKTAAEKETTCNMICRNCNSPQCWWVKQDEKIKNTSNVCSFVPWGPDKQACEDRCMNLEDRDLWGGDKCDQDACKQICESCVDNDYCEWLDRDTSLDFLKPKETKNVDPNKPLKQNIRVIPGNRKIIIQWVTNELEDEDDNTNNIPTGADDSKNKKIMGYVIQYYKTFTSLDGIFTKNISKDILDKDLYNKNNTFMIDNLENGKNYSVSITAINQYGSGEQSNIVSATPSVDIKLNL